MKNRTARRFSVKKLILGILIALGTIIIVTACLAVYTLFFAGSVKSGTLSNNLTDFLTIYEDDQLNRDLPVKLSVTKSFCKISDDNRTFTYTFAIQNTATVPRSLSFQLYYNEDFVAARGNKAQKPLIRYDEEDALVLGAGEEKICTVTGMISGDGAESAEKFKETFQFVYLEALYLDYSGRVPVPVNFS